MRSSGINLPALVVNIVTKARCVDYSQGDSIRCLRNGPFKPLDILLSSIRT